MRTRVPARGRLSSNPSNSRRRNASETGRKLMPKSAAILRREITWPMAISPRRMRSRIYTYASAARLDSGKSVFMPNNHLFMQKTHLFVAKNSPFYDADAGVAFPALSQTERAYVLAFGDGLPADRSRLLGEACLHEVGR